MVAKCELHISGVTFSYLVSSLLGSPPTTKQYYSLFGNYDVREDDSDEAENTRIIEVFLTTVLPKGESAPEGTVFLGHASACGTSPHKLSYKDTELLKGNYQPNNVHGSECFPCPFFFLLLTSSSDISSVGGTIKVEYSVFQGVVSEYSNTSNYNVIPLMIDNMVDPLSGFLRLGSLGSHNPRPQSNSSSPQGSSQSVERTFKDSLAELKAASTREYELLQHIMRLENLLKK
ncbi:hypothetical protein LSM04_000706 [Trypanosoma melophagium]|uniref:uncharacterized protein n=1 Tax=Trypanosoma melophagium TaxID=715481 RepID=UPI00351AA764|nr:hypothetical protein LSM04_000706 [Trypanosoma melophagium]